MYENARKIHLWLGIIMAVVLLVEAITGFILSEPWLVGKSQQLGELPAIYLLSKALHKGIVGTLNLKWIIDLSAIGLVILTLTGVYISFPILRAGNRNRRQGG